MEVGVQGAEATFSRKMGLCPLIKIERLQFPYKIGDAIDICRQLWYNFITRKKQVTLKKTPATGEERMKLTMTATQNQTTKVYIADLTKCSTKYGFFSVMARAFGLTNPPVSDRSFWNELCRRTAVISASPYPVRIKVTGLRNVEEFYPEGVYYLLKIFNALEEESEDLRANAS